MIGGHSNPFVEAAYLGTLLLAILRERAQGLAECGEASLSQKRLVAWEWSVSAGCRIDRHRFYDGERLDGGIRNVLEQQVSEGQILRRHLIRRHQSALKVRSFVSDISEIQQYLPRQLPLDVQGPVLKVRRARIFTIQDVNTKIEAEGWIEERRKGEPIRWPTVLHGKCGRQSSIVASEVVLRVVALQVLTAIGADVAARSPEYAITGAHYGLVTKLVR